MNLLRKKILEQALSPDMKIHYQFVCNPGGKQTATGENIT